MFKNYFRHILLTLFLIFSLISVCSVDASGEGRSYVVATPTFDDVPLDYSESLGGISYHLYPYIQALYNAGMTSGTSTNPPLYSPTMILNRAMAAVFMLRANFGNSYMPPGPPYTTFAADDWSLNDWAQPWAQGMWNAHLTAGCQTTPLKYCPDQTLPRVQAVIFALHMKYDYFDGGGNLVSYTPPPATGTVFADLWDTSHYGTKWAEKAYSDGLLPACGTWNGKPLFCPDDPVDRAWAAYMIVKAKSLPLPPEPPPAGVSILTNHSYYVDAINYLHIVGEVMNNTDDNLRFVKITADFFNNSGQILDTDFTYIWLDNLPSRDKTCFDLALPAPGGWSYYQFEPLHYWTDGVPLPNLAVTDHHGSYNSTFGWYEIIGQVRNDEATVVEYVMPVGTAYNGSGTVVGCDFTFVNTTDLNPGQISAFKMTFLGRDFSDVISYRLQVDGNQ